MSLATVTTSISPKHILTEAELVADRRAQFAAGVAFARAEAGDCREHHVAAVGEPVYPDAGVEIEEECLRLLPSRPSEGELRELAAEILMAANDISRSRAQQRIADMSSSSWAQHWECRQALAAWRWCHARFGAGAGPAIIERADVSEVPTYSPGPSVTNTDTTT